jgi:hypothetical protein
MILHRVDQGSPEWHAVRSGCITASNFKLLRESAKLKSGPNKGDYSEKAKDYAFRVAIERISGAPLDEGFETFYMARGHELEPEARLERELRDGVIVEQVGFVTTDDGKFGASADGFVGADEGEEYKCFVAPDKLRSILISGDTSEVMDQCQGGLWLTGRKAWNFSLYCPALRPVGLHLETFRIERDDDYIEALEQDLLAFERLVTQYELALRRRGSGELAPAAPPVVEAVRDVPPWVPTPHPTDPYLRASLF